MNKEERFKAIQEQEQEEFTCEVNKETYPYKRLLYFEYENKRIREYVFKINENILKLQRLDKTLEWLEKVTGSNEGKNSFFELKRLLCDRVCKSYDRWQKGIKEERKYFELAYSLLIIHDQFYEAIHETVAYVADGAQSPNIAEFSMRLEEYLNALVKTKARQRNAGKKTFKETRKPAVDKARADKECAFELCHKIIKENNKSYKGKSFSKADAVFDYVIDHFYEMKTDGELTGCLRSSNGRKFKASSFRREYYEYYKGKE